VPCQGEARASIRSTAETRIRNNEDSQGRIQALT
jgi:hypothetical protein